MKKSVAILCIALVAIIFAGVIYFTNKRVRRLIRFHIYHRDYLSWKNDGGPMKDNYYEPLTLDVNRNIMINGLSYSEVVKKYPFLIDGDHYSADSYKGRYLIEVRNNDQNIKLLWFNKKDGFDWCIYIDKVAIDIKLIKG